MGIKLTNNGLVIQLANHYTMWDAPNIKNVKPEETKSQKIIHTKKYRTEKQLEKKTKNNKTVGCDYINAYERD